MSHTDPFLYLDNLLVCPPARADVALFAAYQLTCWELFLDGWDAQRTGIPLDANPQCGVYHRALWQRGWRRAYRGLMIDPPRPIYAPPGLQLQLPVA